MLRYARFWTQAYTTSQSRCGQKQNQYNAYLCSERVNSRQSREPGGSLERRVCLPGWQWQAFDNVAPPARGSGGGEESLTRRRAAVQAAPRLQCREMISWCLVTGSNRGWYY